MSRKHFLVTGATGFIGEHLFRFLLSQPGITVSGISMPAGEIDGSVIDEVDLLSSSGLKVWMDGRQKIDVIVHLAALIPDSFSGLSSDEIFFKNIQITRNVLSLAKTERSRVIYLSSSSVYGMNEDVHPLMEDAPVAADNYYSLSKYVGEQLCGIAHQEHGLDTAVLRLSAPYGPGQRMRTVIRIFLEAAMASEQLRIFGTGKRTQDFLYIDDVVQAIWLASQSDLSGVFNIASGQPVSMTDLAETVRKIVPDTRSGISYGEQPDPQETYRGSFSIEKARQAFGFVPAVSLEEGLRKYAQSLKAAG